ncbi:MAG: GNAT family N-acetyltransferase [Jatrophihabitantaceae bacterium]
MPAITVRLVEAEITRELRRSVLRPGLSVDAPLPGDDEVGVLQLAAFAGLPGDGDGDPVSACLLFPEPCPWQPGRPAWRLRSMATDPAWRGRGAGREIIREARQIAIAAGMELIWCLARQSAIDFYRSQGWQEFGELFDTDLGPHRRMWCELSTEQV